MKNPTSIFAYLPFRLNGNLIVGNFVDTRLVIDHPIVGILAFTVIDVMIRTRKVKESGKRTSRWMNVNVSTLERLPENILIRNGVLKKSSIESLHREKDIRKVSSFGGSQTLCKRHKRNSFRNRDTVFIGYRELIPVSREDEDIRHCSI